MNNLILVEHDAWHFDGNVRFNEIVPILRVYDFLDKYIIRPGELNDYLHADNDILYTITARIPSAPGVQADWLNGITEELSDEVKRLANDGQIHIAYFVGEILSMKTRDFIVEVNKKLKEAGLNKNAITVYLPNFELLEDIYAPHTHVKYIPIFEMSYKKYLYDGYDPFLISVMPLEDNIVKEVNLNPRSKKYTCLNHIDKIHRKIVGTTLFNNNLIADGYFSYHDTFEMVGTDDLSNFIDSSEFEKQIPYILDTEDPEVVNFHWKVEKRFFNDAYWNFVTESFVSDYAVLTEKTFKPLLNLQPFVLIAAPGAINALRESGYRTSRLVIDESYDNIKDNVERMKVVTKLIVDLAKKSDEEHIQMMTKLKPMLEHNQKLFLSKTWRDFI